MNDVNFTQKIKQWFDSEHTDDNIREGALMLLQINNNRHLYQQILLRPQKMLDHLIYELQKHYGYRTKGMTLETPPVAAGWKASGGLSHSCCVG